MKAESKTIYHPAFIFHADLQFFKWQFSQPAYVFLFPNSISKPGSRAVDHSPLTCPPAELEAKQQMTQHESLRINRVVITNFSVKSAVDSFLTFIISGEPSHHRPGVPGNEPDAQSLEWLVQGQASVGDTGLPSWLTPYPLLFPLCHKDNLPQKLQSLKTQFMSPEEEARNPSICFWQLHVLKALKKSCQFRKFKLQCLPGKTGLVFKRK